MTKPAAVLPEHYQHEDQLIRKLLADRSRVNKPFPEKLETRFWQSLADHAMQMIRNISVLAMLIYIVIGLLNLPSIYFLASKENLFHDSMVCFLLYVNGAVCLSVLPIMARIPSLSIYYQRTIIVLSFFGVFFTSLLTVQYHEPLLIQYGSYIIIFVYMLVYFLTGARPFVLLITCCVAGILPLPISWSMGVQVDLLNYFYAVIFSNFIGFFISQSIIGKERTNFLQARLLALDKVHAKTLSDRLTRLSNEDALTGLYNRRYFNEAIHSEWDRAVRSGEHLSLVFIDIDCFKNYNDSYGHLKGDDALVAVSNVFKDHMRRTSDMASRYGGEEFILLLPNTPTNGAQVVANNIMKAVDALNIEHNDSIVKPYLTLSIGVATWAGEPDITETQLIAQADSAVYQAKAEGRHLVRVFKPKQ